MFREITKYVRNCQICSRYKVAQTKPPGLLHATEVHRPWQRVNIGLVGPLPTSTNGHRWLFTMQDRFSKWLEIRPLRRATADAVTRNVADAIIYRHGCPKEILSDNGTQLKSNALTELCRKFNIRHKFTPAYTPQCNPVERTNRTIKIMIAQFVGKNHRHWDKHIGALQFAFNTAVHDATGYTPAFLNHGRELATPNGPKRTRPPQNIQPPFTSSYAMRTRL